MYQFFVEPNQINDKTVTIVGSDVNHIKNVLRIKPGEEFNVLTGDSDLEYRCSIREFGNESITCDILFIKQNNTELGAEIWLLQGLPKGDKMELIIQKAVELGASKIVPVAMERSVVKVDDKKADKKVSRWNAISEAAAKQSKRRIIPEISAPVTFTEVMNETSDFDIKILPYEMADMDAIAKTREIIGLAKPGQRIAILIGPEGGFSEKEYELAVKNNWQEITLGHRILRTETAGMVVLSWLILQLECAKGDGSCWHH